MFILFFRNMKILVIDDERSIRNSLKEILMDEGYEVDVAEDGAQGCEMAEKEKYSVIFCDIKMPAMDGLEVLDKLNEAGVDSAVIMISGHGDIDTAVECIKKGAFDFIQKPLDLNRIFITIKNATDKVSLVVLKLQESIREAYSAVRDGKTDGQIIIFGKIGHAEVLGLVGQAEGHALVVENMKMLEDAIAEKKIDLKKHIEIFSQTTKNPAEYASICSRLEVMMARENELPMQRFAGRGLLTVHDTICSQVATRHARLSKFAIEHDILIFVSGKASSNGKVLCDRCKSLNIRTYHIETPAEIRKEWFREDDKVGVCGAASTPKWLLEDIANSILAFNDEE